MHESILIPLKSQKDISITSLLNDTSQIRCGVSSGTNGKVFQIKDNMKYSMLAR